MKKLIEYLIEFTRPELSIKPEIVEREKRFNEQNFNREEWVLNHTYLCEGDLKELEKHPDYRDSGVSFVFAKYKSDQPGKRSKKVVVKVEDNEIETLENKLKLALFVRGANSGVFYKTYKKGKYLFGEAVPATLSGE